VIKLRDIFISIVILSVAIVFVVYSFIISFQIHHIENRKIRQTTTITTVTPTRGYHKTGLHP